MSLRQVSAPIYENSSNVLIRSTTDGKSVISKSKAFGMVIDPTKKEQYRVDNVEVLSSQSI